MGKIIEFNKDKKVLKNINKNVLDLIRENKENYFKLADEDRYDYYILKYVFNNYMDEEEFISRVFDDIDKNLKEPYLLEFLIRMKNKIDINELIFNKKVNKELHTRKLKIVLKTELVKAELVKNLRQYFPVDQGFGFSIFCHYFGYSDIMVNFYATSLIFNEIFKEEIIKKYLHDNYKTYEDFEESIANIEHFIIQYISSRDGYLALYVKKNKIIIDDILKILENIKENWVKYYDEENINRIFKLFSSTLGYINKDIVKYNKENKDSNLPLISVMKSDTLKILASENYPEEIKKMFLISTYILNEFGMFDKYFENEEIEKYRHDWELYDINQMIMNSDEYCELNNFIEKLLKKYNFNIKKFKLVE